MLQVRHVRQCDAPTPSVRYAGDAATSLAHTDVLCDATAIKTSPHIAMLQRNMRARVAP
jgi:hypothetical protein